MTKELTETEIEEIRNQANEKLGACRKTNDIIGTQIFSIIGRYARVIYYPLGKNAPWGFTRIKGTTQDNNDKKPFVVINTSIPVSSQVFAAAHELYHIWYENNPDVLPKDLLDETEKEISEKKANRFAAEFLMDKTLLFQEIEIYKMAKFTIKEILQLSELFTVPYKAMVKRLYETEYIKKSVKEEMLAETEKSIKRYRKKYGIIDAEADERVIVDNLVELSLNAYEKKYISFEKLEYLLQLCHLEPKEFGFVNKSSNEFPSDELIKEILEDDE
ncbi:MAG: ImmA/IrrE family metallo-endopeptidase [Clostridiales bacterium]|nr:ImmA/IrrE family metallo-endopeptidase [Clostridiales bacterium]